MASHLLGWRLQQRLPSVYARRRQFSTPWQSTLLEVCLLEGFIVPGHISKSSPARAGEGPKANSHDCPECGCGNRTAGWLRWHLKRNHGYVEGISPARTGVGPTDGKRYLEEFMKARPNSALAQEVLEQRGD